MKAFRVLLFALAVVVLFVQSPSGVVGASSACVASATITPGTYYCDACCQTSQLTLGALSDDSDLSLGFTLLTTNDPPSCGGLQQTPFCKGSGASCGTISEYGYSAVPDSGACCPPTGFACIGGDCCSPDVCDGDGNCASSCDSQGGYCDSRADCCYGLQCMSDGGMCCPPGSNSAAGADCGICGSYDCSGTCKDPCEGTGGSDECDPDPCPPDEVCVPGEGNAFCEWEDPVILSLDGGNFALTSAADGVRFDFFALGKPIQTSWTAPGIMEGWLAMDRNGDGLITSGKELFSNVTKQAGPQDEKIGFHALAVFDTPANGGNADGWISSKDAVWPKLRIWIDRNHNGISEAQELMTMQQAGVEAISVSYLSDSWVDSYGNQFQNRARVRWSDPNRGNGNGGGRAQWAYDVVLVPSSGK